MKNIYAFILGSALCIYGSSLKAQQLIAVGGEDTPTAIWALGEVINGSYQSLNLRVDQGILAFEINSETVSIAENEEPGTISLWPNPVQNTMNISVKEEVFPAYIHLFNMDGIAIEQFSLYQQQETYNISHLTPGIYYIKLTDNNGNLIVIKKIIKL